MATLYYVIYTAAMSAPSAAQVKAGQDSSGSAATAAGSETARTTTGEQIFASAASGLTAGTSYRVAFVWSDGTDDSNVSVSDSFSTTADQTVVVPAGILSLASYAPTVAVSDHKTIAVPAAALSVTGYAPTVNIGDAKTVEVPTANLALSALSPTVIATDSKVVFVPASSLTLTSYAPIVVTDGSIVVQVPSDTLQLQAYAPTVSALAPAVVAVPKASLELTGNAPTVVTPRTVDVSSASLNITAFAPTVLAGSSVVSAIPTAILNLFAYPPTVSNGEQTTRGGGGKAKIKKRKPLKNPEADPKMIELIQNLESEKIVDGVVVHQTKQVVTEVPVLKPVVDDLTDLKQQLQALTPQETELVVEAEPVIGFADVLSAITTVDKKLDSVLKRIEQLEEVLIVLNAQNS